MVLHYDNVPLILGSIRDHATIYGQIATWIDQSVSKFASVLFYQKKRNAHEFSCEGLNWIEWVGARVRTCFMQFLKFVCYAISNLSGHNQEDDISNLHALASRHEENAVLGRRRSS